MFSNQYFENLQKTGWVQTPGFAEIITNYQETRAGLEGAYVTVI